MSDLELFAWVALVSLGIGLSALFSGLETGVYTLNRVRLAVRVDRAEAAARRLQRELIQPDRLLSTLLVGNNVANYMGTLGVAAILKSMDVDRVAQIVINAGVLIPLLFVFGEVLPKDLFRTHTDRWTYRLSSVLPATRMIFTVLGLVPLLRLVGGVVTHIVGGRTETLATARQRISLLFSEGVGAGLLTESQSTLVERALSMHTRTVGSELTPWERVITVRAGASRSQREASFRHGAFTRYPVVSPSGNAVGVISAVDALLEPARTTDELARPIRGFPVTMPIQEAIRVMRTEREAIRVGIGRDGKPAGIVTLKDLVEPLTGELAAW